MLAEAARQAEAVGITNVDWVNLRAEDLPPGLGPFRAVTLAQSFHWMDRALVARLLHDVLAEDGALVHVHATTHQGVDGDLPLPHPRPPRREIGDLVKRFLGPDRRAGQGSLPDASSSEVERGQLEAGVYRAAGFSDPDPDRGSRKRRSCAVPTTSSPACSPLSQRRTAPLRPAGRLSSRPLFASSWPRSVPTGASASRCARQRSTSGVPSRLTDRVRIGYVVTTLASGYRVRSTLFPWLPMEAGSSTPPP